MTTASTSQARTYHDLSMFALSDMLVLGQAVRKLGAGSSTMEEAADEVVRFFYERLAKPDGSERCCALVRCLKTHPYGTLPEGLKASAREALHGNEPAAEMRCLTLLAAAGDRSEWNAPQQSAGYKAIPLVSGEILKQAPMEAQFFQQMGLEIATVPDPSFDILMGSEQRSFNVFHVENAQGSPYVPAQAEFIRREAIRSVLGFGGMLPNGDLFSVILFSRVFIPKSTADMFSTLALGVKLVLLPFSRGPYFGDPEKAA